MVKKVPEWNTSMGSAPGEDQEYLSIVVVTLISCFRSNALYVIFNEYARNEGCETKIPPEHPTKCLALFED